MENELLRLREQVGRAERRSQAALCTGFLALIASLLFPLASPGVTQERGTTVDAPFTVRNHAGNPILRVTDDEDGPTLRLVRKDGKVCVIMKGLETGGVLATVDSKEEPVFLAGSDKLRRPILSLTSANRKAGGILIVKDDGPAFELANDGGTRVGLNATVEGGMMRVFDSDGQLGGRIDTAKAGGRVACLNTAGEVVGSMAAFQEGGVVMVRPNEGKGAVMLHTFEGTGALAVMDKDGKVSFAK